MNIDVYVFPMLFLMFSLCLVQFRSPNGVQRTGVQMMGFTFFSTLVFFLYSKGILEDGGNPCPKGSEYLMPFGVINLFMVVFVVFLISDLFSYKGENQNIYFEEFFKNINSRLGGVQYASAFIFIFYCCAHYLTRDPDPLWSSNSYLLMLSLDSGYSDTISRFLASIIVPVYFLCCIMFAVSYSSGRLVPLFGNGFSALWLAILQISAASRAAGVGILLFAVYRAASAGPLRPSVLVAAFLGMYVMVAAMAGRGSGMFGLENFFLQLASPLQGQLGVSNIVANLFQGAVSTGDGLVVGGGFSEQYKLLSFSPLPSFIDGFDRIREASEIRLGPVCPMSAVAELANFGSVYWLAYSVGYISMVAFINSRFVVMRTSPVMVMAANGLFTIFSIVGFTYPLRNVSRMFVYISVLLLLFALVGKRSHVQKEEVRR